MGIRGSDGKKLLSLAGMLGDMLWGAVEPLVYCGCISVAPECSLVCCYRLNDEEGIPTTTPHKQPNSRLRMHRTLPRFPDNKSPHKGAIRKPNQCETPQLIHDGIHTLSPYPTKHFIKPSKICRNISQPPLQSHLNWTIM